VAPEAPPAAFPDIRLTGPDLPETGLGPADAPTRPAGSGVARPAINPADFAAAPVAEDQVIYAGNEAAGADAALSAAVAGADVPDGPRDTDDPGSSAEAGNTGFLAHALVERPARRVIPIGLVPSGGPGPASTTSTAPPSTGPRAAAPREIPGLDFERLADRTATLLGQAARACLDWARRRELGPTSLTGMSLALAVCAAAWFSAGTTTGMIRGAAAYGIAYLVLVSGRKLAPRPAPALRLAAARSPARGDADASGRPASPQLWLAALGGSLAECIAYAGLTVGAAADGWSGMWPLAVGVLGLVAVRNLMTACSTPPGFGAQSGGLLRRLAAAAVTMPGGARILLVAIVAPVWGARVALLALLDCTIISIGYGLAGRPTQSASGRGSLGDRLSAAGHADSARSAPPASQADPSGQAAWAGKGDPAAQSDPARRPEDVPLLIRLRDDGVVARSLGVLVRGSLLPLPAAILGIAAVAALVLVGLRGLPGALMIAPAIVMLLAAPGSAHAHTGRFDFLVPVLLLGAQVLYLGAIGLARGVPGPLVYALIAVLLLRYADLASPDRPVMLAGEGEPGKEQAERGSALGWEGRVLIAGLAAAMGIATFAYVALAAYLGLLICVKALTSCLVLQEDAPRDRPGYGSRRGTPPAP
jgi:hypothetical protein